MSKTMLPWRIFEAMRRRAPSNARVFEMPFELLGNTAEVSRHVCEGECKICKLLARTKSFVESRARENAIAKWFPIKLVPCDGGYRSAR